MKTVKTFSPTTKILSIILSVLIVFYLVPSSVFAEGLSKDTAISNSSVAETKENSTYTPKIYEVTELREVNVKHFRLEDGSYVAAQYNYPVHYTFGDGQFIDIDNRLLESGSEFSTSNSRVKFVKKISGNGNIFTLHENNTKITIGLVGAAKKAEGVVTSNNNSDDSIEDTLGKLTNLENISSTITYANILDGVDLEYVVNSLNIKENIIVRERKNSYTYTFTIELNNLTATLSDDGNVYINNNDGETKYIIPAPVVFDTNNEFAPADMAQYTLTSLKNGKYELSVTVSSAWMNADERVFPVTIDPAMLSSGDSIIDFNIDSTTPSINNNGLLSFFVSSTQRAYLQFSQSYFPELPIGTSIMKAELKLKGSLIQGSSAKIGVYPITSSWNNQLTWNDTVADAPEGNFSSNTIDYTIVEDENGRYGWDITKLYKDWLSGGTNYGIGLRLIDESSSAVARFSSYENQSLDASKFRHPAIMVTYIHNDGLENYYPTTTHSAGVGGVGSINLSTGRLTLAIPTLTTTDRLFAFTPTLVYNSSLAGNDVTSAYVDVPFNTSYMPKGFRLNIQETIVKKSYTDDNNVSHTYYSLYDSDGTTHWFFSDGDNTEYYDDSGLRLTLTFSNGDILIEDTSKTVKTYSAINASSWHLTSITDKYNNQLIFKYNSSYQPTEVIVKPNGLSDIEILSFLYENDKLIAVCNDTSKDYVILTYSNGNLSRVRYCYGNDNTTEQNVIDTYLNSETAANVTAYATATYTYNNGYITSITDSDTNKSLTYDITGRKITKVSEYAGTILGQRISYSYGEGYTDVRYTGNDENLNTNDDIINRYVFDKCGRSISVYSMSADGMEIYGATSGTYGDSERSKNSIKSNAVLYGINPEYIIDNSSGSGEYFATIQGGVNTTASTGSYCQTVFLVDDPSALTESNANMEYIISGFGLSNSILKNDYADFSLGVNVYYYQGAGIDDVVVTYRFDFADVENIWQFASGKLDCNIELENSTEYDFVRKIEVVCSYYGQPDIGNVSACARFKDIAINAFTEESGYNYFYDAAGNLVKKENSLYWETYAYDENRVVRVANSHNEIHEYDYTEQTDENNNPKTIDYDRYYHDDDNDGVADSDELISASAYVYNSYGLLTSTSYLGTYEGNITAENLESLEVINTSYEYEVNSGSKIFGALTQETDNLGNSTIYVINPDNGQLMFSTELSSKTGYKYSYSNDGTLSSVRSITLSSGEFVNGPENVNYTYSTAGYLSSISTDSTVYALLYDAFGNALEAIAGDNSLATYEYYPNNGKLKKINYGNGFSKEYVYNTLEMLSEIWYTYDDGTREQAFSYTYNYDGTLWEIENHLEGKSLEYCYDERGRLESIDEKDSNEEYYNNVYRIVFDAENRVSSQTNVISYSSIDSGVSRLLTTSYDYGSNGTLLSETHGYLGSNHTATYTYDNFNRLSRVDKDFGCFDYSARYSYVTDGNNTSYRVSSVNNLIISELYGGIDNYYQYTYDSRGNIKKVVYNASVTTNYIYDDLGQLIGESKGNVTYDYTYDNAGNIISKIKTVLNEDAGIVPSPFVARKPINPPLYFTYTDTFEYTDSEWGDLLTSYNNHTITYDEIGNPLSYYNGSAYTFTWTGRQLTGAVKGSNTMSFTYDDVGIRTSKTVDNVKHTYHLNGSQIIAEEWEDKLIVYLYDASGSPMGMMYRTTSYELNNWTTFFFEKNLQGDVVAVYSSSGLKLVTYEYDAWGNQTVTYHSGSGTGPAQYNPFRYRGYYYDTDLEMYYLQSRYYDPNTCRFINADGQLNTDHILGTNLYTYCYNNPVMYVDYSGNAPDWNLFLQGALLVTMGVITVAATVATGGSCIPVIALAYSALATAGLIAVTVGASEVYESFTGDNPVKDYVGEQTYDVLKYGSLFVMSMGASIIDYGTTFSVCFVAGTIVKASEGDVPIESIQVGDYVYAHNPETGETELKPVVNTFVNEATELVHVFADGEEIICTNEHPFYSPVKGWIAACKLRAGDILVTLNGEYIVVEQVQHEILEAPIKVYNFEVDDFHTYFVGDGDGALVHNTCGPNGMYVDASYHTNGNSVKSPRPINGQAALDNSIQISPNSPRRIGISDGQFVVLDQTSIGIFHGHVRTWNELTNQMQSVLYKWGVVTKNGKFR